MDRATALGRLPETYAEALRLRDAGLDDHAIAARLDVPEEAVALLLRLAEAKLERLIASDEPPDHGAGSDCAQRRHPPT